nr:hypothetical protein BaRGS_017299 [Batillaria attramentaria]
MMMEMRMMVRPAKDEEALLCHSRAHLDMLEETKLMDTQELSKLSQSYDFVYFHSNVEENARLALGGAIDLVEKVVTGQLQNGMAVTRPPGHHAMKEEFNGYCYLNNVAVAASVALEKHGLKRVLIVDWDVHHGQGTQFHFYDDPSVVESVLNVVKVHRALHPSLAYQDTLTEEEEENGLWQMNYPPK